MSAELRILLIDDDSDDRTLAAAVLQQKLPHAVVVEAADALTFADHFAEGDFALVVCELDLGWGSGASVLASIKRRIPECITIAFSRLDPAAARAGVTPLAADAYLQKSSGGFVRLPGVAEQALRAAASGHAADPASGLGERLRSRLPVGVFTLSDSGEILNANEALARLLGFEAAEALVSRQLPDLLTDRATRVELRRQLAEDESCEDLPVTLRGGEGEALEVTLSLWPAGRGAGGRRLFEGLLLDGAQDARLLDRDSDEELAQLTCTLFQELQEPLQLLGQYGQVLGERYAEALDEDAGQLLNRLEELTLRLQSMVRGMVGYFSARRGQRQRLEQVSLGTVLSEAVSELDELVDDSGAEISSASLPSLVGDRRLLVQLFRQLLTNAIKFRTEHPPAIRITAEERANDWLISVSDNGLGIAPEASERIFGMFERLHDPGEYPGSGVGLAIARRIAQRHGGDIWVREREGGGSVFMVTFSKHLPRRRPAQDPERPNGSEVVRRGAGAREPDPPPLSELRGRP